MIKPHYSISLILLCICHSALATAIDDDLSNDFLDFIADMDEITGDGFENWLESEPTEQEFTESEDMTTSN